MICLTPAAARQINRVLEDAADDDLALRVAARRMPDGGIDYALGLDEPRDGDLEMQEKGVPVLVGAASRDLLQNTQIDYVEFEPGDLRFIFIAQPADGAPAQDRSGTCGSGACGCQAPAQR